MEDMVRERVAEDGEGCMRHRCVQEDMCYHVEACVDELEDLA